MAAAGRAGSAAGRRCCGSRSRWRRRSRCCSRARVPAGRLRLARAAGWSALAALFAGYVALGPDARAAAAAPLGRAARRARRRPAGARHRAAAVRQRRPVAADRARAARHRAADPRRAADVLAALGGRRRTSRAPLAVPDRGYPFVALARADRRRRVAGRLARRAASRCCSGWRWPRCRSASCGSSGCRCGPGSASRRCWRSRWPARCRWRRWPTAASRGSTTARSPRASAPTTRCGSRGSRATGRSTGRATATRSCGSRRASRCTGRRATSTSSTARRGRSATSRRRTRAATSRSRPTCPRTGRTPGVDGARSTSASAGVRTSDVFGAGTTIEVHDASRAVQAGALAGHLGRAERPAARRLLHGRGPRPEAVRRRAGGGDVGRARAPGRRAHADRAVQAGQAGAGEHHRRRPRTARTEAEVHFAPLDGEGLGRRQLPVREPRRVRHRQA